MKIHFIIADSPKAQKLFQSYTAFPAVDAAEAEVLVVLGGDGFMLKTIRAYRHFNKPFYGINCGSIGFLMNRPKETMIVLNNALKDIKAAALHPLCFDVKTYNGVSHKGYAINELVLMRKSALASKIRILVSEQERMVSYGDGVLLSTPAGSTAYNCSAGGPILPLDTNLLALTPLSIFKPKNWRGAILKDNFKIEFEVLEANKRPVNLTYDNSVIEEAVFLKAYTDYDAPITLWFDAHSSLEERILKEQFI
jgi:NAD+ kinase